MVIAQCIILVGAGFPYPALIQAQLGISDNILRLRYHTNVPRNTIASLLHEIDPHGVEVRRHRVFRRRSYTSLGRNFCWQLDGKLKTFGFSVHAWVDCFSR